MQLLAQPWFVAGWAQLALVQVGAPLGWLWEKAQQRAVPAWAVVSQGLQVMKRVRHGSGLEVGAEAEYDVGHALA